MKKVIILIVSLVSIIALTACQGTTNAELSTSGQQNPTTVVSVDTKGQNPIVTMTLKTGEVIIELYPDKAPNTVNNFISLINKKFYDGLTFHRVISGFMIQGGDVTGTGTGDSTNPGYSISGEFSGNDFIGNDIKHEEGVISMARTQNPNSADSQFFIMVGTTTSLDGEYAAFGKVTSGLEYIKNISTTVVDENDKPVAEQLIVKMVVDTKGIAYPEPVIN